MTTLRRSLVRVAALLAALSLLAAACGDDDDDTAGQDTTTSAPTETTAGDGGAAGGATEPAATVALGDTELGSLLVDENRRTVYVFENDSGGESTCYDQCAGNWPPVLVDGEPTAGDGVDASLLGTTQRTDGSTQVTYNGRPLYRFAADIAEGDTNGHGVGGVWFAMGADGEPIES